MVGQQKGADQRITKVSYGHKNWVSECGGGEQATARMVGRVPAGGGGYRFCGRRLHTEEQTWDNQHVGVRYANASKSWDVGCGILEVRNE